MQNIPGAIPELEKAATLAPGSPQAHFMLARAYTPCGAREADAERERAEFTRLDQIVRAMRQGQQWVRRFGPPTASIDTIEARRPFLCRLVYSSASESGAP